MIRKSSRAFSLVETAIVLGVAGLVLGGLWVAISNVRERARLAQTVTDVAYVVQGVRDYFRNSVEAVDANGKADDVRLTHYIIERGLLPPDMLRSRSLIGGFYRADHPAVDSAWVAANPTAGSLTIESTETTDYLFYLTLKGLTKANCIVLTAKLTAGGQGLDLPRSMTISDTDYNQAVTPAEANTSCKEGNDNYIGLSYRLRDNM